MTNASSASQSSCAAAYSGTVQRRHTGPRERVRELGEQRRVLGQIAAHLPDVGGVVQPDADDLAGGRGTTGA